MLDIEREHEHERWTLPPAERALVASKNLANQLTFAALLTFFRDAGRFPRSDAEIDPEMIDALVHQLALDGDGASYDLALTRTVKRHRAEIRTFFGFRETSMEDAEVLSAWLRDHAVAQHRDVTQLAATLEGECRQRHLEPPAPDRIERIVRSALSMYEERFHARTLGRLSPIARARLDALLLPADGDTASGDEKSPPRTVIRALRSDSGRVGVNSMRGEFEKLAIIRNIELPPELFGDALAHDLESFRQRVAVETPWELRRHAEAARLTWLAAFVHLRGRAITDTLTDLLVDTVHRINAKAERRVDEALLDDLRRVTGKTNLLFRLADATLAQPDGVVRDVVFPVVGEATLNDLVREWKATGPAFYNTRRAFIRNSYKSHYRQMIPKLLAALDFRSNNEMHRPVIEAIDLIRKYSQTKLRYFPSEQEIPLGFLPPLWRETVIDGEVDGRPRINRITYEIATLTALRDQVRCKEIWVSGADRYRNPDEDVPADFEKRRDEYYTELKLPRNPEVLIAELQNEMRSGLQALNDSLPRNSMVTISGKAGGWIHLTPLDAQPESSNVTSLKAELGLTWPMTSLLDILKETDLRLNFSDALRSVTSYENLERAVLRPRLLLCLHGIGTNTGLQRMNAAQHGATYRDLAYCSPTVHHRREPPQGYRHRRQRHVARAQSGDLGRWDDGLCIRFQALRRLGSEPHYPVAHALWRPRDHDLLARRAQVALHTFATQGPVLFGSRLDDRRRSASCNRDERRPPIR